MTKKIALLVAMLMLLVAMSACAPAAEVATPAPAESAGTAEEAAPAETEFKGEVVFGVVAPITGNNSMVGEYITNGANMAADEINAAGGINGYKLSLVFEDEVDTQQASVNAASKIMEYDDIVAFFGSTYSGNCIAASPIVKENGILMFAGSAALSIAKEENPYIWLVRTTDNYVASSLGKAAVNNLGMKNPAILYCTNNYGVGVKDQLVPYLASAGFTVPESQIFGFDADEQNFSAILTLIQESGADGLIAIGDQMPAALICQQMDAAGMDIPRIGSSSWASAVCRTNAGASADGWYGIADWTIEVTTETGKAFADKYLELYGADSDMPAVTVYDSIYLFKAACEKAGTVTDGNAIRAALAETKDYPGAMTTYTAADNQTLGTTLYLTFNEGGKATMADLISID